MIFFYYGQLYLFIAFSNKLRLSDLLLSVLILTISSIYTLYLWDLAICELSKLVNICYNLINLVYISLMFDNGLKLYAICFKYKI